jgi:DNA-binding Xre family transcriptional regulator
MNNRMEVIKQAKNGSRIFEVQQMHLAREVRHRMQCMGMSQQQLADKSGLHRNTIYFVCVGSADMKHSTMLAICEALECTIADLFQYDSANDPDRLYKNELDALRMEQIIHDITY